jgi:hypothetical protein
MRPIPLINKIAFGAWGVVAIPVALWAFFIYAPDFSGEYVAAASQNGAAFRVSDFSCVSVDSHAVVYDQKEYIDPQLAKSISDVLAIKNVFFDADVATCPWYFSITGISGRVSAVRYDGGAAHYLVSIGVCERKPDGRVNPNRCLSKNIYVFNQKVGPRELFMLALVGLARPQATEWEAYRVNKGQLRG